jgi:RHS repeat-associated protein
VASRVTHVDATGPQWPTGHHTTYAYDLAGNRYQKTTIDGVFNRDEVIDYDPNNRLKRVTLQNPTVVREAYDYDPVGNRLQGSWAYDASNRLYTGTDLDYTYDANGNRKTWEPVSPSSLGNENSRAFSGQIVTGKWIYNWDAENRLMYAANTDEQAPVSTAYEYDALGRRKLKTVGSVTTKYIYDGDAIFRTKVGAIVTATYTHGPSVDEPLLMENAVGVKTYLHADALGSIVATFSGTGSLKTLRSYDSFGNFDESGSQANFPYAFTGREWDRETGLYYYRARYYDPKIARFIGEDPIRWFGGWNLYTYVANNPQTFVDPSGLQTVVSGPQNPKGVTRDFNAGFADAINRLNRITCSDFFGGPGCSCADPAFTMKQTTFRFMPLGNTSTGAATMSPNHVVINTRGLFVTASSGRVTFPSGASRNLGNADAVRSFILLHELGHQLKQCTGWVPDASNAQINQTQSLAVIKACF